MENKLRKLIRKIVREALKDKELEEATTTGNVEGYDTPMAFSDGGKKSKKKASQISQMLYTFPLFVRERSILSERFYRMLHAVNHMEKVGKNTDLRKQLEGLFDEDTLNFETKFQL